MARTPTLQQASCIAAAVDTAIQMLKIEACAGAGKTSTLTMMAEANTAPSLYLAFNKVTANEAAEKFPNHVTCRTTHSLAYAKFGTKLRDKLSRPTGGYVNVAGTGSEIGKKYKLSPIELSKTEGLSTAFLGLLIRSTVARFEQSADQAIGQHHVPRGELMELQMKTGANMSYTEGVILAGAKALWKDRIDYSSNVLATHDTYLKMYQLSKPKLAGFDVLYIDEAQDSTPCVMDIILQQRGRMKIVFVGDARQAIYQWRGSVNAMQLIDCESRSLTKSFRYGQPIADIATAVLEGALRIEGNDKISSVASFQCVDKSKPYTRLFRTNAALLQAAITAIQGRKRISIEIDVKDFVKLLTSAVALKEGITKDVKHESLLPYRTWESMTEEAKHAPELSRIVKVVASGEADTWIQTLTSHVNSNEPEVTFTSCHKSKGRDWPQVCVEGDFKSAYNEDGDWIGLSTEEQNLLYVACTRAIDRLEFNQTTSEYLAREKSEELEEA
jgi:superfamily I DNA/RNA helicase